MTRGRRGGLNLNRLKNIASKVEINGKSKKVCAITDAGKYLSMSEFKIYNLENIVYFPILKY